MIAPKLANLRTKSIEDIEAIYDNNTDNVQIGLDFLRREIEWRYQAQSSARVEEMTQNMQKMTSQITELTITIKRLTLVAVLVSLASLAISTMPLIKEYMS